MKKPELLVTAGSFDEVKILCEAGADAVLIGEYKYALRISGEIPRAYLPAVVDYAHERDVKVYVAVNQIVSQSQVEELASYLLALQQANVDAVVFGDPAVIIANRKLPQPLPLHWNGEMTSTNYGSAMYWAKQGATRVVLARELNLEQIRECKQHLHIEVQVQVHGMTNIYHSKRRLLESYMQFVAHKQSEARSEGHNEGQTNAGWNHKSLARNQEWVIIERERRDQVHPILEDESGTHIMSSDDLCMIENLAEILETGVDSLKIEGLMKSLSYQEIVVRSYREAIDHYVVNPQKYTPNPQHLAQMMNVQDPKREFTYGFYYKEQVY